MPTPTIPDGELFMNATLYTGNGSTQTITNGVAGQSFQPDLVWVKSRSGAFSNWLNDAVRGAGLSLASNTTEEEKSYSAYFTAFNSNGFALAGGTSGFNATSGSYVAWQWKAGGAAVTNTAGSISAQVSANTTSGFSVVTYTGTGSAATIGHGLGVAPRMIIVKNRVDGSTLWSVYHASVGAGSVAHLNSTAAFSASGDWNSTTPTSSVYSVNNSSRTNASGQGMVAYCWAPVAGYSAFGSYTGNGSSDGPFVYLGFRPRFIMIKRSDSTGSWAMFDTSRNPFNSTNLYLNADLSDAEGSAVSVAYDLLSNGFKFRSPSSPSANLNASGGTYIYMAFCENPLKYANAR